MLALKCDTGVSPVADDIRASLAEANDISVDFCWVPMHFGVKRNEKADMTAKDAYSNENHQFLDKVIFHTDMKRPVRDVIEKVWQNKGLSLRQIGRKLKRNKARNQRMELFL